MKGICLKVAAMVALLTAATAFAQPKPKSQKEVDAIVAMQNAADADARIKAANELLTKFADTEFKTFALQAIVQSYQQKGDSENVIIYSERLLAADPKSYIAQLSLAQTIAQKTREFDLDKEEKLGRAEKMAKGAQENIKVAEKFNPAITDAQWDGFKKDQMSESFQALGMIALARKKYDDAAAQFKLSVDSAASPDPATMVRLGSAYLAAGKPTEALAVLDKVLAMTDLHPAIKQYATSEKQKATAAAAAVKK